ncbi:hypothetical protein EUGRSUZ_E04269 [Eucalyptus grandis]|uniref:Uncharacterized protein n=2 Tax=Eucalyptus grandis TaxID=71139 RepID=A0ACC3L0X7_EUCGR|nr:hypothetical protein EUGRSUZ_E04269 [Eucalyptus grandis]
MSMGFKERNARRALYMTNNDVVSAVDFLIEEKAKKLQKREEDMKRRLCIQISMGSIKNLLNLAASKSLME